MAALVLAPKPTPSQKPAPSATTFFSAPHSSTPATSRTMDTLKDGRWKHSCQVWPVAASAQPMVASQNSSCATCAGGGGGPD
eukprot:scaffold1447_cov115-Isochrysis_galbana.AAC.10